MTQRAKCVNGIRPKPISKLEYPQTPSWSCSGPRSAITLSADLPTPGTSLNSGPCRPTLMSGMSGIQAEQAAPAVTWRPPFKPWPFASPCRHCAQRRDELRCVLPHIQAPKSAAGLAQESGLIKCPRRALAPWCAGPHTSTPLMERGFNRRRPTSPAGPAAARH
jgi:hypothetical protein